MKKSKQNKGITLIALVITIIVMLILVAVTINMAVNGGLFDYASRAARETNEKMEQERELANIRGDMTTDELIAYYTNGGSAGTGGSVTRYAVTQAVQALPAYSSSLLNNNGVLTENAKYEDSDGNVAPIPAGFKVSSVATEQKVANGLVIEDADGNQFVWVPVVAGTFERTGWFDNQPIQDVLDKIENGEYSEQEMQNLIIASWGYESLAELIQDENEYGLYEDEEVLTSWDDLLEHYNYESTEEWFEELIMGISWEDNYYIEPVTADGSKYQAMVTSVTTYGGFYIGRYEAGWSMEEGRTYANSTDNWTYIPVERVPISKSGAYPYNFVTWTDAEEVSRNMYPADNNNYGAVSTLCYGVQWDAVLRFIADEDHDVTNSSSWGNYCDSEEFEFTGKYYTPGSWEWVDGELAGEIVSDGWHYDTNIKEKTAMLLQTGASERNKAKNIYDIAGNVSEWTMEVYFNTLTDRVFRGDEYGVEGWINSAAHRNTNYLMPTFNNDGTGFRVALYL